MPLQSAELNQYQGSPQTDVLAPCLNTTQLLGITAGVDSIEDLHQSSHCLDNLTSEISVSDEEQLMHKMLCCPITKVRVQLGRTLPCLV